MNPPQLNVKYITTSDEQSICYRYYQHPKTSRTLVFLHGVGGCSNVWLRFFEYFKDQFSILLIDLRGHGLSSRPNRYSQYSLARHAQDIGQIIDTESICDYVFIGHSLGAMVSLQIHESRPDKIKGLVLIGVGDKTALPIARILSHSIVKTVAIASIRLLPRSHKTQHRDYHHFKNTGEFSITRIASDLMHTSFKSYCFSMLTGGQFNISNYKGEITCLTKVISASDDRLFPLDSASRLCERLAIQSPDIICDSYHHFIVTHPEILIDKIHKFILESQL